MIRPILLVSVSLLMLPLACKSPPITPREPSSGAESPQATHPSDVKFVKFQKLSVIFSSPVGPYPPGAKREGIQGEVVIDFAIDETGHVSSAKAISGPIALYSVSESMAKHYIFKPYSPDGTPIKVHSFFHFVWRLP